MPSKGSNDRALHAYLSPEVHERWHDFAADKGTSVSGMVEAWGIGLTLLGWATDVMTGPQYAIDMDVLIKQSRQTDARRRRRGATRNNPDVLQRDAQVFSEPNIVLDPNHTELIVPKLSVGRGEERRALHCHITVESWDALHDFAEENRTSISALQEVFGSVLDLGKYLPLREMVVAARQLAGDRRRQK